MRDALFILLGLVVLAGLTVYRYRKQIRSILEFWKTIQTIRSGAKSARGEIRDEPAANGPLVHCPKCGTWVPEERAIRLGRTAFYCSTKCLEASSKTA